MNFEKLNDTSCRIDNIQNNDRVLIGGTYPGRLDIEVIADIDKFEDFFNVVEKNATIIENNNGIKNWLKSVDVDLDIKTFSHIYAFDNVLRKMYPNMSSNVSKRRLANTAIELQ